MITENNPAWRMRQLEAEVERLTKRCEEAREIIEDHCYSEDEFENALCPACCRDINEHKPGCHIQKWLEGKP